MLNVTSKRIIKPYLILWSVTYDLMSLKQTHIRPQMPNDIWTNPIPHISTQESCSLEENKKRYPKANDVANHLPQEISNEKIKTPPINSSNSPSTHVVVSHGTKVVMLHDLLRQEGN